MNLPLQPRPPRRPAAARHGFILLEVMVATAIFVVGVLALGSCLTDCLSAQQLRQQEERMRLALENQMAEIQASPALPDQTKRIVLKEMFTGITIDERRRTLELRNEDNVTLPNLHEISLVAQCTVSGGRTRTRDVSFILLRGQGGGLTQRPGSIPLPWEERLGLVSLSPQQKYGYASTR